MIKENQQVYYEPEVPADDCPKPDPQNFVKTISMAETINALPILDNQFRHLVPPAVRQMGEELKAILQGVIQAEFTKI
jgi:hypothetical protein